MEWILAILGLTFVIYKKLINFRNKDKYNYNQDDEELRKIIAKNPSDKKTLEVLGYRLVEKLYADLIDYDIKKIDLNNMEIILNEALEVVQNLLRLNPNDYYGLKNLAYLNFFQARIAWINSHDDQIIRYLENTLRILEKMLLNDAEYVFVQIRYINVLSLYVNYLIDLRLINEAELIFKRILLLNLNKENHDSLKRKILFSFYEKKELVKFLEGYFVVEQEAKAEEAKNFNHIRVNGTFYYYEKFDSLEPFIFSDLRSLFSQTN
ncbi:MAG: hypothetical protein H0V82_03460 [Candidatus Protochlamydia sp.]|nr:hypothetical protein [Candidatus Protochlamydia sp.]